MLYFSYWFSGLMYFTHNKYPLYVNMKLNPVSWGWLDSNIGLQKYQKSNLNFFEVVVIGVLLWPMVCHHFLTKWFFYI